MNLYTILRRKQGKKNKPDNKRQENRVLSPVKKTKEKQLKKKTV